jgi:protein subunit release factor A
MGSQHFLETEKFMQSVIVEIRAAEGGDDAKLLVEDQLRIYNKFCSLNGY